MAIEYRICWILSRKRLTKAIFSCCIEAHIEEAREYMILDEARQRGIEIRNHLVILTNAARPGMGNHLLDANQTARGDIWKIFGYDGVNYEVTFSRMEEALPGLGEIAAAFLAAEISQPNVWVILGVLLHSPSGVWQPDSARGLDGRPHTASVDSPDCP